MSKKSDNVIRLQDYPGGVPAGIRSSLFMGREELVANGPNSEFQFIGSDPWNTNVGTGIIVPPTPSSANGNARYLILLQRASFGTGEQSSDYRGVRLVGIRQYAELIARIPARTDPPLDADVGPPTGSTVTFRKEITSPMWHPFDGNISWHVTLIPKGFRDRRNPSNTDGFIFQDAKSPAVLYQTGAPSGVGYTPPNGGRPWGKPFGASLGNMHDLRYPWRSNKSEYALDIPIPVPCDIALFASVRQNDPTLNPSVTDCCGISALGPEDQFATVYNAYAQYGLVAGSLVFDRDIGSDVP